MKASIFKKKWKDQDGKCYWCDGKLLSEANSYVMRSGNETIAYDKDKNIIPGVIGLPELDHLIPRSCGGTDDEKNIVLACDLCNQQKSNRIWVKRKDGKIRQYFISSTNTIIGKVAKKQMIIKTIIKLQ